ncbi:GMC oxidoreductase [Lepidopterella palustris CBS 459.81]|uniref:GMC oxidoreductase n=1 Tax=Lepidopterella palustris CBS 459.81 TaxID=1314670 RepID=A0A8E2EAK4_9PEZI|nr:GMC oxidoreductase [Lepidopterella palustris CBS 459.81]
MPVPFITPTDFCARNFDYLVVGGGTAGLVVAARLSENENITVGVLEAGPASFLDPIINVPGRFGESLGTKYDWQFETTPQPGLNGRKLQWPRGRVLGGTSALNFMTWNRGNREDYDAWEELGNQGWGWDSLLPFFKRTESFVEPSADHQAQYRSYFTAEFHGTNGPVKTVYSKEYSVPHQFWHATLENLGVETNKSHFSGSNLGAWTTLTSVDPDTRTRCYSATAYYLPNSSRSNLVVLTEALAIEIVLEQEGSQNKWVAKGVKFTSAGKSFTASVSREVIVSAGSVQSPLLLELSGIGNPTVLEAAGITAKVNNPNVGENLQEHMMTAMVYELDPSIVGPDELRINAELAEAADLAYSTTQSGIRAMLPCALSYVPVSYIMPSQEFSNLTSRISAQIRSERDAVLAKQFCSNKRRGQIEYLFDVGNWNPYFKSEPGKVYGTMLMMLQLPFTKGSIHIPPKKASGSSTINDRPVINPQYYAGPGGKVDFEIMTLAQRFAENICSTSPLSSIIRTRAFPPAAAPAVGEEDFTEFVRNYTITDWHPIGTCGMGGLAGITTGVVDDRLRVYGAKGLRVVDASIMPLHICSHPQATIYAIAEKAASMILEDCKQ